MRYLLMLGPVWLNNIKLPVCLACLGLVVMISAIVAVKGTSVVVSTILLSGTSANNQKIKYQNYQRVAVVF